MSGHDGTRTVGQLPEPTDEGSWIPATLTRLVWLLWVGSLAALAVQFRTDGPRELAGVVTVDGLTVVMWVTVTFFSGVVHSFSRRYMAGDRAIDRFFARVFAFTLIVMVLVAADNLLLFGAAWLAMGLVIADLVGVKRALGECHSGRPRQQRIQPRHGRPCGPPLPGVG